jgi:hypothetical protein
VIPTKEVVMSVRVSVEARRGCGYRKEGGLYLVSGQLSEPCPLLPYETSTCPTCGEGIKPARGFTWVDGEKFIPPVEHGTPDHNAVCPLSPARADTGEYLTQHDFGWSIEETSGMFFLHGTGPEGQSISLGPGWKTYEGALGNLPRADEIHAKWGGEIAYVSRIGRCGLIWIGEQHYKTPQEFMREAAQMGVSRRIVAVPKDFKIGETWVLLGHRKAIEKACSECGDLPERNDVAEGSAEPGEPVRVALTAGPDPDCPVCNGTGYEHRPGIITAFKPTAIEYVVKGDETDEELEALEARGIEPVKVVKAEEQEPLPV